MKQSFLLFILLILILQINSNIESEFELETDQNAVLIETPDLVTELTDETFENFLKSNDNIFLNFFAAMNSNSSEYSFILDESAQKAKELNIPVVFAKLDSQNHPSASGNFKIKDYPKSFLVQNGDKQIPYDGERDVESILDFIKINSKPLIKKSTVTINNLNDLNELVKSFSVKNLFLYLGESSKFNLQQKQIINEKDTRLFYSNDTEILDKYSVKAEESELINFKWSNKSQNYKERILNLRLKNYRPDIINELILNSISNKVTKLTDNHLDRLVDTGFPTIMVILNDSLNQSYVEHVTDCLQSARKLYPIIFWYFIGLTI